MSRSSGWTEGYLTYSFPELMEFRVVWSESESRFTVMVDNTPIGAPRKRRYDPDVLLTAATVQEAEEALLHAYAASDPNWGHLGTYVLPSGNAVIGFKTAGPANAHERADWLMRHERKAAPPPEPAPPTDV